MNREVVLFGCRFTVLRFVIMTIVWTISLIFLWPTLLDTLAGVFIGYTVAALIFAGFVNRKILLLILLVFVMHKKSIVYFQNFMLFISGLLSTLVYRFFRKMDFWLFLDHYLLIGFSVFLYYTLVVKVAKVNED